MNEKQVLKRYLDWMKKFNPLLYNAVKVSRPDIFNTLKSHGLNATETTSESQPWYASVLNTIADTAKAFLPIYQQKKILDTQLQLAKAGQPMLTNQQIANAGTTHIQVDLPPEIQQEVVATTQAAGRTINWVPILLLGGGLLLAVTMGKKKRR